MYVLGSGKTHQIDLKAIEGQNPISNIEIKPESVVQVKQGDNLVVFTQPTNAIDNVKLTDSSDVMTTLTPLPQTNTNMYSLAGYPVGVYILDVIVDLGSNQRGAYETILVILEKDQTPVQPAQIIKQIQPRADIIIFDEENCRKGFVFVKGNCVPIPCKEGYKLDPNSQKCVPWPPCKPDYQSDGKGKCIPIVCKQCTQPDSNGRGCTPPCRQDQQLENGKCIPRPCKQIDENGKCVPPYCDENTPVGQVCRDEGEEASPPPLTPTPEPIEGIPDVPEEGGEDNDNGNGDDSQPEPDPPEDNDGDDTDTGTDTG